MRTHNRITNYNRLESMVARMNLLKFCDKVNCKRNTCKGLEETYPCKCNCHGASGKFSVNVVGTHTKDRDKE